MVAILRLDTFKHFYYNYAMLKRKKLNRIRRERQAKQNAILNAKAKKKSAAKLRKRLKYLKETQSIRNERFRRGYMEMIHIEPLISSLRSIQGVGIKKKSVLE